MVQGKNRIYVIARGEMRRDDRDRDITEDRALLRVSTLPIVASCFELEPALPFRTA